MHSRRCSIGDFLGAAANSLHFLGAAANLANLAVVALEIE
jgi:hypothetical protein